MNRNTVISLIVVLVVCLAGVGIWLSKSQEEPLPAPAPPPEAKTETPEVAPPPPEVAEAFQEPEPQPVEEAPQEPEQVAQVATPAEEPVEEGAADDDPFGGQQITIENLTGCKEVQTVGGHELVIEYAPNGEWKMNGNVRAKWTIVGNQVKIYRDDSDEVHYIDIVKNKLVYNGKELNMTR